MNDEKLDDEKIVAMDVWHCQCPVKSRRDHGIGSVVDHIDVVVVRLTSSSGLCGFGEASPWPVFNGTAEASLAAFDRYFKPYVLGASVADHAAIMQVASRVVVDCSDAKAALEAALLDLAGKSLGVPVSTLLGGAVRKTIPLSCSIANPDFNADIALTEQLQAHGIRIVKFKAGTHGHAHDIMRIEYFQKHFPEFSLRVDYNQGLLPSEALRYVRDIDSMQVDFIEQPVAARHWDCMASLRSAIDTPLLADESIFTPTDMVRAVREKICDGVSVKIMKSGGLKASQCVAGIAEAAGLAVYGGDMFETGLAHLAGTHMIAATPAITLGCEFYQARFYLEEDLLAEPFPIAEGEVIVPSLPGLGVEIDLDKVRSMSIASIRHE